MTTAGLTSGTTQHGALPGGEGQPGPTAGAWPWDRRLCCWWVLWPWVRCDALLKLGLPTHVTGFTAMPHG